MRDLEFNQALHVKPYCLEIFDVINIIMTSRASFKDKMNAQESHKSEGMDF